MFSPLLFNTFSAAVINNVASTRFKADNGILDALVHLRKKRGAGKQLPKSQSSRCRCGARFTLTMPGSSRNHPRADEEDDGGDVVVCAVFDLTVSETKTEIMCLRAKRMPECCGAGVQPDERVCIPQGERQPQ